MKDKCAWCNEPDLIPENALMNVEYYGSNQFNLRCPNCNKVNQVILKRTVELVSITKSISKETDF